MQKLAIANLCLLLHFCNGIICDWYHEYLCGDKCLLFEHICYCGNSTLTLGDTRYVSCCANFPCTEDADENVICLDGTAQSSSLPCNGTCKQDAEHGWVTLPCDNHHQCYLKVYSCLGRPLCDDASDLLHCSEPNHKDKCKDNLFYTDCDQIPNAAFKNYACTDKESEMFSYFDCPNRMDKARVLFEDPPVPTKRTRKAINYNRYLDFDENFVYCGERNFSFVDFDEVKTNHPEELCVLNNGEVVTLNTLWFDLKLDFSFLK